MKLLAMKTKCALALVIAGIFAAGPVMAGQPVWAGSGKGGKQSDEQRDDKGGKQSDERRADREKPRGDRDGYVAGKRHFEDRHRVVVREYFDEQFRGGRCPPGLAKKNNGCMPPGQAKKWQLGRPLPREVIYYEVPHSLVVQIGLPPSGHRYVRVASDILMVAIGTGMVIDAIQDMGR